eukprot:1685594-Prorocentrum_lima.AAC.1
MVDDKKFIKIAVDPAAMKAAMETKTTSVSVAALDAQVLRSACQNNVVATIATLAYDPFRRQLSIMV